MSQQVATWTTCENKSNWHSGQSHYSMYFDWNDYILRAIFIARMRAYFGKYILMNISQNLRISSQLVDQCESAPVKMTAKSRCSFQMSCGVGTQTQRRRQHQRWGFMEITGNGGENEWVVAWQQYSLLSKAAQLVAHKGWAASYITIVVWFL